MKKGFIIVLVVIVFIALMVLSMYLIDMNRIKNNKSVVFGTWGYDYVSPVDVDETKIEEKIENYIIESSKDNLKENENQKSFCKIKIYGMREEIKDEIFVYAWVVEHDYYMENSKLIEVSGFSIPYRFTVNKINDEYEVTAYKIPRDGSYYAKDMKEIFPDFVLKNMEKVHDDGTVEKLIEDVEKKANEYFNIEQNSEKCFIATVLEENTNYMLVKPNEDEEEYKSSDKIRVNYGQDNIDYLYGVGRKVLIEYDGDILETYPSSITANKISVDGYEDFEIIVKEANNLDKIKILNNKDLYDLNSEYDLYYKGLEKVEVKINGNIFSLEDALKTGKITLEGIISKANKDANDGKIISNMLNDGGSILYHYDTYEITKYHKIDGNRDVYISNTKYIFVD